MATANDPRVNKDTSARKNTIPPKMHFALEVAAIKAAHDAYVSSMVTGYEEKIESQECTYAEDVARLQKEHSTAIASLEAAQKERESALNVNFKNVIKEAYHKARQGSLVEIEKLRNEVANCVKERDGFRASLDESLAKDKRHTSLAKTKTADHEKQIATLTAKHEEEVRSMQAKIAITVHFVCKARKTRSFLLRPSTTISQAVEDLGKNSNMNDPTLFTFKHNGQRLRVLERPSKTLREAST